MIRKITAVRETHYWEKFEIEVESDTTNIEDQSVLNAIIDGRALEPVSTGTYDDDGALVDITIKSVYSYNE